jgi:DNA-binding NtrC family response regulator
MRRFFALSTLLISAVISLNALACGDSLYRVGKGVSYRIYTAPLPGSVLVYGQSEGAQQLAEALAKSGHGVRLVSNPEELESELESGGYDVVIASYSEHEAIEATRTQTTASQTTYLPVALDSQEESLAKQDYDRVMIAEQDEIKHYLKAIHKTLKSKA